MVVDLNGDQLIQKLDVIPKAHLMVSPYFLLVKYGLWPQREAGEIVCQTGIFFVIKPGHN